MTEKTRDNNEIWKYIKGYYKRYSVSNMGNVYSNVLNRLMTPVPSQNGYLRVYVSKKNSMKCLTVSRIVAKHFVKNQNGKEFVNHINGIKTDNRAKNLEWCTPAENTRHAINTGLMNFIGENNPASKLTQEDVNLIREFKGVMTQREIGSIFGIVHSMVYAIHSNKNWL